MTSHNDPSAISYAFELLSGSVYDIHSRILPCRYNNALKKANIASLALQQQAASEEDADEGDDDLQVLSFTAEPLITYSFVLVCQQILVARSQRLSDLASTLREHAQACGSAR